MSTVPSSTARPRRAALAGAAVAFAIVMFAAGYWLGGQESSPGAENPHRDGGPPSAGAGPAVGRLEDLLPALEAKVAANPGDHDQRLLLARTYGEIGQRDQAVRTLRALRKDAPRNNEVVILLATALMEGSNESEWREAYRLFDTAVGLNPAVAPMARLYQGEVSVKLGDRRTAQRIWTSYLRSIPADDPRRAMFEQRLAGLGLK